jgi:hypothetical protein
MKSKGHGKHGRKCLHSVLGDKVTHSIIESTTFTIFTLHPGGDSNPGTNVLWAETPPGQIFQVHMAAYPFPRCSYHFLLPCRVLKRGPNLSLDRCYDFKNILAEKFGENICIFCLNCCYFLQKFDHNIGFWENANFFAENLQKSQKIVIIASTPLFQCDAMFFFSFRVWLNLHSSFVSASEEASLRQSQPGLPDGLFSKPKIPIWVNIWGPCTGQCL